MGAADQPRDSWGRYAPRPGGRAAAPTRPTAEPVFKEGKREVHLTNERTPHYQVWDGDELVSEKPATRSWRRDQDEAVALARGVPRDTSNFVQLSDRSQNAVINAILRGAREAPSLNRIISLRSDAEKKLERLLVERWREDNHADDPEKIATDARRLAGEWAAAGSHALQSEIGRQLEERQERDIFTDNEEREQETYG